MQEHVSKDEEGYHLSFRFEHYSHIVHLGKHEPTPLIVNAARIQAKGILFRLHHPFASTWIQDPVPPVH